MKKLLKIFTFLLFPLSSPCYGMISKPSIVVAQIVEHPALDNMHQGIKETLTEWAQQKNISITWMHTNAQGNPSTAIQIAKKVMSQHPNLIISLSTPMTQAFIHSIGSTPLVFGAVTNPEEARLICSPQFPNLQITGVIDKISPEKQLALIKKLQPQLKSLGVIYNRAEINSLLQVEALRTACNNTGITLVETTVSKTTDVLIATNSLVGKIDALLLPTDNTVVMGLEGIIKITKQRKIPLFGSDVDLVDRGILAAVGVDWKEAGHDVARKAIDILEGKKACSLPIQSVHKILTYLNKSVATEMGITIPQDVLKQIDKII